MLQIVSPMKSLKLFICRRTRFRIKVGNRTTTTLCVWFAVLYRVPTSGNSAKWPRLSLTVSAARSSLHSKWKTFSSCRQILPTERFFLPIVIISIRRRRWRHLRQESLSFTTKKVEAGKIVTAPEPFLHSPFWTLSSGPCLLRRASSQTRTAIATTIITTITTTTTTITISTSATAITTSTVRTSWCSCPWWGVRLVRKAV